MNNLNIQVGTLLNTNTQSTIQSELNKIKNLKVNVTVDTSNIKSSIQLAIKDAFQNAKLGNINVNTFTNIGNGTSKGLQNTATQIERINKAISNLTYEKQITELQSGFTKLSGDADKAEKQISEVKTAYQKLVNTTNANKISAWEIFNQTLVKQQNQLKINQSEAKEYIDTFKQVKLKNDIETWLKNNSAATKEAIDTMQMYLNEINQGQITPFREKEIRSGMNTLTNEMRQAERLGKSLTETFKEGAKSFAEWTISSGAVMEAVHVFRNVIKEVYNLNKATVELQMATGASKKEVYRLLETYQELGDELSATTSDIADAANDYLRQGKSIAETNELIRDSVVLAKIGQLETAEATTYLTTAMKGYAVETKNVIGIVDKLSAVDMASATSAGGLAEAMAQVANNANLAGVSMDKLLGYIAVIGETTGEGMSSVGTGLNAIFSRMGNIKLSRLKDYQNNGEDLSNVETVLRGEGILLRDTANEFRNFGEVLDEVAGRWTSFSEVSQRAIASAFAGTHHMEQFMVLMSQYDKAMQYTTTSLESTGTAMQKFEAYEEGLEGKTERFKNAFQSMSDTVVDSGLIGFFVDLGTTGINAVDSLIEALTPLGAIGLGVEIASIGSFIKNFDKLCNKSRLNFRLEF